MYITSSYSTKGSGKDKDISLKVTRREAIMENICKLFETNNVGFYTLFHFIYVDESGCVQSGAKCIAD